MIISRKIVLTCLTTLLAIVLVLPLTCLQAQGQTDRQFSSADKFDIPTYNGTISFDLTGSYQQANLQNDTWQFVNLRVTNSTPLENFGISARNSNVTISSYLEYNNSIVGLRLRLRVVGHGVQTVNFGFVPKGGEWGVTFNGIFMAENDGWRVSSNGAITMTAAIGNVSLNYYTIPDALGGSGNTSNQSFYQQHSVILTTTIAVAIAIVLVGIIRLRNKNISPEKSNAPKFSPGNSYTNENARKGQSDNLNSAKNSPKGRQR
jgi:hypothetical protein